jgi:hypothetical protein
MDSLQILISYPAKPDFTLSLFFLKNKFAKIYLNIIFVISIYNY